MLTQEKLKEKLKYSLTTGLFIWINGNGKSVKAGNVAGCFDQDGYIKIKINRTLYMAHRLAWLYVYGNFPSDQIDHINCFKSDNRISNLREATASQNHHNLYKNKNNTSGYKNVCFIKGRKKWRAGCYLKGKFNLIGYFSSPELAYEKYVEFAKKHHGEFYREIKLTNTQYQIGELASL